jgi:hypothetical protein
MFLGVPVLLLYVLIAGTIWHILILLFIYFKWDDLKKGTPGQKPEERVLTEEEYKNFRKD